MQDGVRSCGRRVASSFTSSITGKSACVWGLQRVLLVAAGQQEGFRLFFVCSDDGGVRKGLLSAHCWPLSGAGGPLRS
jgi:hypothetical protein